MGSLYDHITQIRQRYQNDIEGWFLGHSYGNGVISAYCKKEGFEVSVVDISKSARNILVSRAPQSGLNLDNFHLIDPEAVTF